MSCMRATEPGLPRRLALCVWLGCGDNGDSNGDPAATEGEPNDRTDAAAGDGGDDDGTDTSDDTAGAPQDRAPDSLAVDHDWEAEHCAGRDCYYVMQGTEGASDTECSGRHREDLDTSDAAGKRDCPFASLTGPVRELLAPPPGEPSRSRTVFVGEGSYGVAPWGLRLRGDGGRAEEAVRLTTRRGAALTIDGSCPDECEVQGPGGPVTLAPCCARPCPSCDAASQCVPNAQTETECAPDGQTTCGVMFTRWRMDSGAIQWTPAPCPTRAPFPAAPCPAARRRLRRRLE